MLSKRQKTVRDKSRRWPRHITHCRKYIRGAKDARLADSVGGPGKLASKLKICNVGSEKLPLGWHAAAARASSCLNKWAHAIVVFKAAAKTWFSKNQQQGQFTGQHPRWSRRR
jgi:hypothetical protein